MTIWHGHKKKKTVVSLESRSSKASSTNWNSCDAIFHGAWLDALYSTLKKLWMDKNLQAGKRLKNNKDDCHYYYYYYYYYYKRLLSENFTNGTFSFFFWNTEIVIAILKLKIHTKSGLYAKNWSSKFKNFQKYPRFSLWLPAFLCCL